MKNLIFGITFLAVLTHINPAYAKADTVSVENSTQPVTALINNWSQFRAGIIARTSRFDKYSDIKPAQLPILSQALTGRWDMVNRSGNSGYQIHAVLDLKKNHRFAYDYQLEAAHSKQDWAFSGKWQEKNKILMLLINKSSYPGEASGDVLFWRLLRVGHSSLVYVRTGAQQMQAMTRESGVRGS